MAQLGLGFRVLGQQFLEPRGRRLLRGSDRDRSPLARASANRTTRSSSSAD
ncbi:hypothetical protein [Streptomyces sp. NPDC002619]|uniref:hypothetical protein n=1 Tax=Streptomyces sp. NPDC002619 TaxID=3364655 RepID=UPI0036830151